MARRRTRPEYRRVAPVQRSRVISTVRPNCGAAHMAQEMPTTGLQLEMASLRGGAGVHHESRSRLACRRGRLMRNNVRMVAGLFATLALSACGNAAVDQSITGVPSLRAGEGGGTTQCEGTLPPGVYENVIVPPGASCVLNNSTILRNVTALPRSEVTLVDDQVGGDIVSHNAVRTTVQGGTVGGSIRIKGGGFRGVAASVNNVLVSGGNVEVDKVEAGIIVVIFTRVPNGSILASRNITEDIFQIAINNVGQSIEVFDNTGPAQKIVNDNFAGIAVRCEGNTPPFLGGPNFAPTVEGQCF